MKLADCLFESGYRSASVILGLPESPNEAPLSNRWERRARLVWQGLGILGLWSLAIIVPFLGWSQGVADLHVIARTGQAGLTTINNCISINNGGLVAFRGITADGWGSFTADGSGPRAVRPISGNTMVQPNLQLNDDGLLIGRRGAFFVTVDPVWSYVPFFGWVLVAPGYSESFDFLQTWAADGTGNMNLVAEGRSRTDGQTLQTYKIGPFSSVGWGVTMNNVGQIAFLADQGSGFTSEYVLATPKADGFHTVACPLSAQPMMADDGLIVLRYGRNATDPIVLLNYDLSLAENIASSASGFTALGRMPGISDDGRFIAFYGDLSEGGAALQNSSPGPGVFMSYPTTLGRGIKRIAGALSPCRGATLNGFEPNMRVGVNTDNDSGEALAVFVATSAAGKKGVYTSRLDPSSGAVAGPSLLIEQGDQVGGLGAVEDLSLYDSINTRGEVAFWIRAGAVEAVVRAEAPPVPQLRPIPIQSVFNSQPEAASPDAFALVAGKDLVVRIFFDTGMKGPATEARAVVCLDNEPSACPPDRRFETTGRVYPAGHPFSGQERRRAENSLNVFITGEPADRLLSPGCHEFFVQVSPVNAGQFPVAEKSFKGDFRHSQRLNLFVVPVTLRDEGGREIGPEEPVGAGPADGDRVLLETAGDFLRTVYPVNEESVVVTVLPPYRAIQKNTFDPDDFQAVKNYFLVELLAKDKWLNDVYGQADASRNFILGVLNNKIGANNAPLGRHEGLCLFGYTYPGQLAPGLALTLDRLPEGDPTIGRPNRVLIGATVAHEIGHLFGFGEEYIGPGAAYSAANPPHGDFIDNLGTAAGNHVRENEQAFDVSGLRPRLAGRDGDPAPSEPEPAVWVVDEADPEQPAFVPDAIAAGPIYGYMGGSGRGGTTGPLGAGREGGGDVRAWTTERCYEHLYRKLTASASSLKVRGQLANNQPRSAVLIAGSVTVDGRGSIDRVFIGETELPFSRPSGSQYKVELRDPAGAVLDQFSFDAQFKVDLIMDGARTVTKVPFSFVMNQPGNVHSIALRKGDTVLADYTRTRSVPALQLVATDAGPDTLALSWTASDADGDPLRYMVLYSPNGADRYVLAGESTVTDFTATWAGLPPPSGNAAIIVRADDGFNWTEEVVILKPLLTARTEGSQVVLAWPVAARGFVLESSDRLSSPATWSGVAVQPVRSGTQYEVRVNSRTLGQTSFYRLSKRP